MRLRTAHRNKQRAVQRALRSKTALTAKLGWREWLEKMLPHLMFQNSILQDSVWSRILERANKQPDYFGRRFRFDTLTTGSHYRPGESPTHTCPVKPMFVVIDDIDEDL